MLVEGAHVQFAVHPAGIGQVPGPTPLASRDPFIQQASRSSASTASASVPDLCVGSLATSSRGVKY